jgi:AcrR family transcriptional regulator
VISRARTQAERTRTTTDQLVSAARELFAAEGYDATYLDAVVERAGVTKGALYHHFDGKRALFAAVYEAEQRSIKQAVYLANRDYDDSWEAFFVGCRAFFDLALDSGFQHILIAAPAVLGWHQMREIEDRNLMALIKQGLKQAMEDGHIKPRRVEPLAHQVHGAICEAAMVVARSDDPPQEARDAYAVLTDLLNGLALDRGKIEPITATTSSNTHNPPKPQPRK